MAHMMTSLRRFLGVISLMVAAWLLPALAFPIKQLTVDVFNATIDNTAVFTLPLDKLTDMLGRPAAIEDPSTQFPDYPLGPEIHYTHYGLSFWCNNKRKDAEQHCWMMTVYLARASEKGQSFVPFSGPLTPRVNASWKAQQVQTEFASYGPKLTTTEDWALNGRLNLGILGGIKLPPITEDLVRFDLRPMR